MNHELCDMIFYGVIELEFSVYNSNQKLVDIAIYFDDDHRGQLNTK